MPTVNASSVSRSSKNYSQRRRGSSKKKSNTPLIVCVGLLCLLILGGLLYWILKPDTSKSFDIDTLEAYIDGETVNPSLKSEISVYIDFSDGMNSAFASSDSQNILKALMNKLSGKELDAEFYSLANNKISQIDASKTTGLYN